MKLQRAIALALLVAAATVFGMTSRTFVLPAIACVLAAIGVTRRFVLTSPVRPFLAGMLLALVFLAIGRISPFDNPSVRAFLFYPVAYSIGQFLLVWMAVQFFLRRPTGLPALLPLYAVGVCVCAGDVLLTPLQARYFQLLSMATVALSVGFFVASRQACGPRQRAAFRFAVLLLLVILSLAASWFGSSQVKEYDSDLNRLFDRIVQLRRQFTDIGFDAGASVDFSQDTHLQGVNRIKLSPNPEVMLRVFGPSEPGYMRASIYDTYADSRWTTSAAARTVSPSKIGDATLFPLYQPGADAESSKGNRVASPILEAAREFDVWPSPTLSGAMFVPLGAAAIRAPVDELTVNEHQAAAAPALSGGVNYQALVPVTPPDAALPDSLKAKCLQLPEAMDPRIVDLAGKVFAGCDDTASRIAAVERYFRDNYQYSLSLRMPAGEDPLTYFLVHRPAAHCEFFASGAAILLRLGHVPARYVTGFVAAERNDYGHYWVATNNDAHAWVEAWVEGSGGKPGRWVIVEATPAAGVPDGTSQGSVLGLWDSIRFRFLQMRVAIEVEGFRGLLLWLGRQIVALATLLVTTVPGLLLLALAVFFAGRRWWKRRKTRPHQERPTKEVAQLHRLLARADRRARRLGLSRAPNETLHHFAARLRGSASGEELALWYERYAVMRYRGEVSPTDLRQLAP